MSTIKNILTFTLNNLLFAVDSLSVREIIWLHALTPLEEAPPYISGVFNLRGKIVPVMDLNVRFGHEQKSYHINDSIIILEVEDTFIGIIVNGVHDVIEVPESDIEPAPSYGREDTIHPHFIEGEVKAGEDIIMLLNHNNLVGSFEFGVGSKENPPVSPFNKRGHTEIPPLTKGGEGGFVEVSPEDMAIFHRRAISLIQPPESLASAGQIPLSVVSLNNEYYGVSLDTVKEFSEIKDITPVPCTPPHIVGDMNLRGDILTLVDIRGVLNLPVKGRDKGKIIVAHINDLIVGITVDDVLEVINISPSEFRPVPASVSDISHEYIKGEFPYNEKMLSILDLRKILTNKEFVVDEEA